jgi:glutamine cyclotransferase
VRKPVVLALLLTAALSGCAATPAATAGSVAASQLRVQVVSTLPHDVTSFTEGLELDGDTLYESTGLSGQSSLREGPPGAEPAVRAALPAPLFGEGITVVGSTIWQLTWQNGFAIQRDKKSLAELKEVPFTGEGWGLCDQTDQNRLVMSNGSDALTFRDPSTFAPTAAVTVHDSTRTYDQLNELECVGDTVYANVWQTDTILRIDPATGQVTGSIDASGLLTADEASHADVLNGIAAIPGTDEFLITGKLWPKMFRVKFVPVS